jgi:hypothetical protein
MLERKELMDKLTQLELEEKAYKRLLDCFYYDYNKRTYYFNLLKKTQKEIPKVKFRLKVIKEMKKNVKNRNTNSTNNKEKPWSNSND